ncbi:hypothetical protein BKA56DRAFT_59603 [Ilyonectria sp. MPI-CAGE-AT-0026]|nr:hypothetical protein BKA56DRAFT_59603 [Ilyonectria sp. MPI-CAGE-AT-0026]
MLDGWRNECDGCGCARDDDDNTTRYTEEEVPCRIWMMSYVGDIRAEGVSSQTRACGQLLSVRGAGRGKYVVEDLSSWAREAAAKQTQLMVSHLHMQPKGTRNPRLSEARVIDGWGTDRENAQNGLVRSLKSDIAGWDWGSAISGGASTLHSGAAAGTSVHCLNDLTSEQRRRGAGCDMAHGKHGSMAVDLICPHVEAPQELLCGCRMIHRGRNLLILQGIFCFGAPNHTSTGLWSSRDQRPGAQKSRG